MRYMELLINTTNAAFADTGREQEENRPASSKKRRTSSMMVGIKAMASATGCDLNGNLVGIWCSTSEAPRRLPLRAR